MKKFLYRILHVFTPIALALNIRTGWMKKLRRSADNIMHHEGREFIIDKNDDGYLIGGNYEKKYVNFLKRIGKPEWVVADVGANIGYFSVVFGKYFSKVYSIEALPDNARLLEKNTLGLPVEIIKGAASDKTGKLTLYIPDRKTDCSIKKSSDRNETLEIDSYRLDDLIKEKVDLLKIDVQGAETEVLSGAKNLIEKYKPMMMIEYENAPNSLLETLRLYGYRFYSLNIHGKLIPQDYLNFNGKPQNIIAFHYTDDRNVPIVKLSDKVLKGILSLTVNRVSNSF